MNFYEILGVSPNASSEDIRKQYQELARKHHPDKSKEQSSSENFIKVTEAWQVLSDLRKRKEYDDQLKREQLYQKFPISEELFQEDLEFNESDSTYIHSCRCGGIYSLAAGEAKCSEDRELAIVCSNCSLAIIVILTEQLPVT